MKPIIKMLSVNWVQDLKIKEEEKIYYVIE